MKKLSLILLVVLFACVSNPAPENMQDETEVKVPVEDNKSDIVETPEEIPEETRGPQSVMKTYPLLKSKISYFSDGILDETRTYSYLEGTPALLNEKAQDAYGVLVENIDYEIEKEKTVKKEYYDSLGKLKVFRLYEYGPSGNMVGEYLYDNTKALLTISQYSYDQAGNKIEWTILGPQNNVLSLSEYAYRDGNLVEVNSYDESGNLVESFTYEYEEGLLYRYNHYNDSGKLADYSEYIYNEKGLPKSLTKRRANKSIISKSNYEYDDSGNMVKEILLDAKDKVKQTFVYDYEILERTETVR